MDCSLLVESAAVKTARIAKYAMANAILIYAIGQAAILCDEARAITVGHQLSEFRGNAFVLLRLIEERFTLKKIQNLAKLLVDLNGLICYAHETPAMVLDRSLERQAAPVASDDLLEGWWRYVGNDS